MAQIQKGTSYTQTGTGSQVTHTNLNAHVDNATLLAGAVTEQASTSVSTSTDEIIIAKVGAAALNKQTKAQFTDNITSSTIQVASLTVGGESVNFLVANKANSAGTFTTAASSTSVTVTQTNHGFIVGEIIWVSGASLSPIIKGKFTVTSVTDANTFTYDTSAIANTVDSFFTSTNGLLVTVTSTNHNLTTGQTAVLTTTTSNYSGSFVVTVTDANTFTYTLFSAQTAASGIISWTCNNAAVTTQTNIAGIVDSSNISNKGPTEIFDSFVFYNTDGVKLPSGTTLQRPRQPEQGHIRYNTTFNTLEVFSSGFWKTVSLIGGTSSGGGVSITLPDATFNFTGATVAAATMGDVTLTSDQVWTITIPEGEYWTVPPVFQCNSSNYAGLDILNTIQPATIPSVYVPPTMSSVYNLPANEYSFIGETTNALSGNLGFEGYYANFTGATTEEYRLLIHNAGSNTYYTGANYYNLTASRIKNRKKTVYSDWNLQTQTWNKKWSAYDSASDTFQPPIVYGAGLVWNQTQNTVNLNASATPANLFGNQITLNDNYPNPTYSADAFTFYTVEKIRNDVVYNSSSISQDEVFHEPNINLTSNNGLIVGYAIKVLFYMKPSANAIWIDANTIRGAVGGSTLTITRPRLRFNKTSTAILSEKLRLTFKRYIK